MVLAPDPFGEPKVHINGDPDDHDAEAFIDDYSIFTDRRGEEASEHRREFYRQVELRAKVGQETEISLNIGANTVSRADEFLAWGYGKRYITRARTVSAYGRRASSGSGVLLRLGERTLCTKRFTSR
jgi:hypothetical protein